MFPSIRNFIDSVNIITYLLNSLGEVTNSDVLKAIPFINEYLIAGSLALAFYAMAAILGIGATLIIYFMYKTSPVGIHPLGGERAAAKFGLFMLTIILHAVPFTAFAPWFLAWAWYVKRHPA